MPQLALDVGRALALLEQATRECVSQAMRRKMLWEARRLQNLGEDLPDTALVEQRSKEA